MKVDIFYVMQSKGGFTIAWNRLCCNGALLTIVGNPIPSDGATIGEGSGATRTLQPRIGRTIPVVCGDEWYAVGYTGVSIGLYRSMRRSMAAERPLRIATVAIRKTT